MTDWWEKYDNIILLVAWMAENGSPASEIAYAVEKPWKFEEEFKKAQEDQEGE